jgi:uncharacterized protein (TIGR02646 family)
MIKLDRIADPTGLTQQDKDRLIQRYKDTGESVWRRASIQNNLATMSQTKCAYCELRLRTEARYLEVEHFRCKKDFAHLVVEWTNLLPICGRCNRMKGEHNVDLEGLIVEPTLDNPGTHIYYSNYRLHGRDALGRRTIEVLFLNDPDHLVQARFDLGEALYVSLEQLELNLIAFDPVGGSARQASRYAATLRRILAECQRDSEFGALAATIVLGAPQFAAVKSLARQKGLWSGDLENLADAAAEISLAQ